MKDFSSFEKQLIDEIIRLDETGGLNVIGNILHRRFNDHTYYIEVDGPKNCSVNIRDDHMVEIGRSITGIERIKYVLEQTSKDIFVAVKLFEYLEAQNLIYTFGIEPLSTIGPKVSNARYTPSKPMAEEIGLLIQKYIAKIIVPTHSLVELRNKAYLSDEEIRRREDATKFKEETKRFKATLRWTQYGVWAASAAAVAAAVTVWLDYSKKEEPDTKLQETSTAIRKSLDNISAELNAIGSSLNRIAPNSGKNRSVSTDKQENPKGVPASK